MSKEILLRQGAKAKLMQVLNTTYPTVRAALKFETDTEIAKRIRHYAMNELGGVVAIRSGNPQDIN